MSYQAVVCEIDSIEPIIGADNIVKASVLGYVVVVGKDAKIGDVGVYFDADGQLSEEFCNNNDLVIRKDEQGNRAGGYLESNRRVRAIKLRGVKSEGLFLSLSSFSYVVDISKLKIGTQFDSLNGKLICNKYETPATLRTKKNNIGKKKKNIRVINFYEHVDTSQLRKTSDSIPIGARIFISEKMHGTSHRTAYAIVERDKYKRLTWLFDLFKKKAPVKKVWEYVHGTRHVVLFDEKKNDGGYYDSNEFRFKATEGVKNLHKGEIVFGEIVGYQTNGKPIMDKHNTKILKDKSINKFFGDEVTYKYGCLPNEAKFYVYRIVMVNEDGDMVEYSWPQVIGRCRELGLNVVKTLQEFYLTDHRDLIKACENILEVNDGLVTSTFDSTHPMEGVVVRWEKDGHFGWLKEKAYVFKVLEGILKESDDYVDIEESS